LGGQSHTTRRWLDVGYKTLVKTVIETGIKTGIKWVLKRVLNGYYNVC
jgi:hypothetical protein